MMDPTDALRVLAQYRKDEVVLATMTADQIWARVSSHPLDLPAMGSMGKASSLALGLALARPERRIWVVDGDGSLLSNLGSLVTIGHMAPANLVHFVLHNKVYQVSGGQPVPGAGKVDFCGLARSAGYRHTYDFSDLEGLQLGLPQVAASQGPALVCLHVEAGGGSQASVVVRTAQALRRVKEALEKGL